MKKTNQPKQPPPIIDAEYVVLQSRGTPRRAVVGGANKGAHGTMSAILDFNARTEGASIVPIYTDPVPERARNLANLFIERGGFAEAIEGRFEEQIGRVPTDLVLAHVDNAAAMMLGIDRAWQAGIPILGYVAILVPGGDVGGLSIAVPAHDREGYLSASTTLGGLAQVTARQGSDAIFGASAEARHAAKEPLIRDWFSRHAVASFAKIQAGLDIDGHAVQMTFDGTTTMSVHPIKSETPRDPELLAKEVLRKPATPVRRDSLLMIVELLPEAVKFHEIRYRKDGTIRVKSTRGFDQAAAARAEENVLAARRAASNVGTVSTMGDADVAAFGVTLLRAIFTRTATRTNPIVTTD